jgi:foldase protein PrsA
MKNKKVLALLLAASITASALTGCGGINKNKTVATLDGEAVTLGVANFAARLQQATYDDFYVAYFGEEVWSQSYGDDTMEGMTKSDVIDSIEDMYVLKAHMDDYGVSLTDDDKAAITEAAEAFISDNSKDALNALGADESIVEEYLTLLTIKSRMREAIIADADTEVSDEEANTSTFSYIQVSKDIDSDDDETDTTLVKTLGMFATEAKSGTLEDAADSYDYTVRTGTFTSENDSLDDALYEELTSLSEGEVSDVIEGESYYYVARLDAETDADATEETRESIISDRQSDLYDEVLDGWKDESEWVLDEKAWAKVTFDNLFTTVAPETEEAEDTEVSDTTEAAEESLSDTEE